MGLVGSLETMAVIIYFGEAATSSSSSKGSDGTRDLSKELAKGVVLLQCESSAEGGACDVYLVETAHVSQESLKEVKAVINYLKPEVVFLELCASRVAILTQQNLQATGMGVGRFMASGLQRVLILVTIKRTQISRVSSI